MTKQHHHHRVGELFRQACALGPDQRLAFLDRHCEGDEALRREVLELLAEDDGPTSILNRAALGEAIHLSEVVCQYTGPESTPQRIGQYDIIRKIGAGGMGVVYEARQQRPQRTVALKVINAGIATPGMLRRFEHEAQVLGRLQHPGIAQIFEAGTFDAGAGAQPFFAMELIRGEPLTRHATLADLDTAQRLDLMADVCDAVQHAHQRGVIHRDLKPGNILVDESGQPKILDFGVARATDADTQTTTLATDVGQLVGTVPYMSPEQAAGDPGELDTRSDVYALGVVTYELVAGRMPYDIGEKKVHEAVRMICEDDPTPLSSVNRVFRGDLETIVGKALEKDKTRRYQSASALSADIHRYLNDEPIAARPPSTWYHLHKFSRRHKTLVAGVAAVFVVLVAGLGATGAALSRALTAEGLAAERLTQANEQVAIAGEINRFLQEDLLAQADPANEPDRDILLRTVLDRAAERIEGRFEGQSLVEASVRSTLGTTYGSLGEYDSAVEHHARALDIRELRLGERHADTMASMEALAELYRNQGRYADAEPLLDRTLALRGQVMGPEDAQTLDTMLRLGELYVEQGRYDEAEKAIGQVVTARRRDLGDRNVETQSAVSGQAAVRFYQGRYAEAAELFKEVYSVRGELLGAAHPLTLSVADGLSLCYQNLGRLDAAEDLSLGLIEAQRRVLGEDHPDTLLSMHSLGFLYLKAGREVESIELFETVLDRSQRVLGDEHLRTLSTMRALAGVNERLERFDESETLYLQALGIQRRVLGAEHPETLVTESNLGYLYERQQRYDEAETQYLKALGLRQRILGEEHTKTVHTRMNLGSMYVGLGRFEEAEEHLFFALDAYRRTLGADSLATIEALQRVGKLYTGQQRHEEAAAVYLDSLDRTRRVLGVDHPRTMSGMSNLASAYRHLDRYEAAAALYAELRGAQLKVYGAADDRTVSVTRQLVELFEAWGRPQQADKYRRLLRPDIEAGEP